jgi:L-threonylcarbamoyladenylate synthase
MPGPLTVVAEKRDRVPDELNGKFVFRISSSPIARKLAEQGPITATSANISGAETAYKVDDIDSVLLGQIDYAIDVGELEIRPTSTIVELDGGEILIHREGAIKKSEIKNVLDDRKPSTST